MARQKFQPIMIRDLTVVEGMVKWATSGHAHVNLTFPLLFVMQLKSGNVRVLANVACALAKHDRPSEVRMIGLKMLQVSEIQVCFLCSLYLCYVI